MWTALLTQPFMNARSPTTCPTTLAPVALQMRLTHEVVLSNVLASILVVLGPCGLWWAAHAWAQSGGQERFGTVVWCVLGLLVWFEGIVSLMPNLGFWRGRGVSWVFVGLYTIGLLIGFGGVGLAMVVFRV